MRRFRQILFPVFLLAASASSAPAAGELVLRQQIVVSDASKQPREQMQYFAGPVRITDDTRMRTIVDLEAKTLTVINKKDETYSVTTFAELEKRQGTHDQRIKKMPPQVRDMVHADDKVVLKKTGKTEKIAGYDTVEYSIESKGVAGNVWIADAIDLGPQADKWRKTATLFGGQNSPGGHLEDALANIKGVPLRRTIIMEPLPLVTTEVLEVKRTPPPAELKRIPPGYRKVDLPAPKQSGSATPKS